MTSNNLIECNFDTQDPITMTPMIIRLWLSLTTEDSSQSCKYGDNFRDVLTSIFNLLEQKKQWTACDFENLLQNWLLLKLNCGKLLHCDCRKYVNRAALKKFNTVEKFFNVEGTASHYSIDFGQKREEKPKQNEQKDEHKDEQKDEEKSGLEWEHIKGTKDFGSPNANEEALFIGGLKSLDDPVDDRALRI